MKAQVVIFGTGKLAETLHAYLADSDDGVVKAFTEDAPTSSRFCNLPVVKFSEVERLYPPSKYVMLIAIGHTSMNSTREKKFNEAKAKGYQISSFWCDDLNNVTDDLMCGEGCLIFEGQTFQQNVRIGNDTVIWSGNHFGHDVKVGDHVFISSHVVLSGNVEVGDNTFIGVNATVGDGVKIGKRNLIGAGALILRDTKDDEVYIEQPTKPHPISSSAFVKMFQATAGKKLQRSGASVAGTKHTGEEHI